MVVSASNVPQSSGSLDIPVVCTTAFIFYPRVNVATMILQQQAEYRAVLTIKTCGKKG